MSSAYFFPETIWTLQHPFRERGTAVADWPAGAMEPKARVGDTETQDKNLEDLRSVPQRRRNREARAHCKSKASRPPVGSCWVRADREGSLFRAGVMIAWSASAIPFGDASSSESWKKDAYSWAHPVASRLLAVQK